MKSEEVVPDMPLAPMCEADIEAAAAGDPDNPPPTPEREAQLKPVPRVRTLSRALGLTQKEFAARYHIPLGTLRDWEQGRSQNRPGLSSPLLLARRTKSPHCCLSDVRFVTKLRCVQNDKIKKAAARQIRPRRHLFTQN